MFARLAIVFIGMVAAAQARPRILDAFGGAASGGIDLLGAVSAAGDGLSDTFSHTTAQASPRVLDAFGAVASGGVDLLGTVSAAGDGVSDAFSHTFGTIRTFGDEFRGLVHGAWNAGKQTASRFTSAVKDTARGAARGISDAAGAVNTYFADNVRAGGRLASGAVGAGFGVARGAVGATGNLLHDVRGTVKGGFEDTADAVNDFAGDFIDSHINLLSAATGVAEDVAKRGIENFAHVLAPSRF